MQRVQFPQLLYSSPYSTVSFSVSVLESYFFSKRKGSTSRCAALYDTQSDESERRHSRMGHKSDRGARGAHESERQQRRRSAKERANGDMGAGARKRLCFRFTTTKGDTGAGARKRERTRTYPSHRQVIAPAVAACPLFRFCLYLQRRVCQCAALQARFRSRTSQSLYLALLTLCSESTVRWRPLHFPPDIIMRL
jgi:hypothetical protein